MKFRINLITVLALILTIHSYTFSQKVVPDSTLREFKNGLKLVRQKGYYGLVNSKDTANNPCKWTNIMELPTFPNMYLIDSVYNYGLIDKNTGKIILHPEWAYIDSFRNNITIVCKSEPIYTRSGYVTSSYLAKGLANKNGAVILPAMYFIKRLSDGSFVAKQVKNDKILIINNKGKIQKELVNQNILTYKRTFQGQTYDSTIAIFNNKSFLAREKSSYSIVSNKGEKTPLDYELSENFHISDDSFPYIKLIKRQDKKESYTNNIPNKFMLIHVQSGKSYLFDDLTHGVKGNTRIFTKDNKQGVLSDTGIIIPNIYIRIRKFKDDGYYAISMDTNVVLLNERYKPYWVSPYKAFAVIPISKNRNLIELLSNKWGVIDNSGKTIIDIRYTDIDLIFDKYIKAVEDENGYSIMDINGNMIIPPDKYTQIYAISDKKPGIVYDSTTKTKQFFIVYQEGQSRCGIIDITGKKIVEIEYDDVMMYLYSTFLVKKGDKWGIVNFEGQKIVEPRWTNLSFFTCPDGKPVHKEAYGRDDKIAYIGKDGKKYAILFNGNEEPLGNYPCFSRAASQAGNSVRSGYGASGSSGGNKN